jgi:hypothetical protein
MKWESARGPMSIDAETRDVVHNEYIRMVEKVNGQLYNVEFATVEAVKGSGEGGEEVAIPGATPGGDSKSGTLTSPVGQRRARSTDPESKLSDTRSSAKEGLLLLLESS